MAQLKPGSRRRGIPPVWVLVLVAVAMYGLAGLRYAIGSSRSWEITVVVGTIVLLAGLVVAAVRRSWRAWSRPS